MRFIQQSRSPFGPRGTLPQPPSARRTDARVPPAPPHRAPRVSAPLSPQSLRAVLRLSELRAPGPRSPAPVGLRPAVGPDAPKGADAAPGRGAAARSQRYDLGRNERPARAAEPSGSARPAQPCGIAPRGSACRHGAERPGTARASHSVL